MQIDSLIDEVIGREGGYVNHPADKGGPTRWGVTEAVARAHGFRGDMRAYPRDDALAVYRRSIGTARATTASRRTPRKSRQICSTPGSTWARRPRPASSSGR